tara:strand:- start:344 stop:1477 length:1134 start_codon:yes stop_codon:yes gene_type:complete
MADIETLNGVTDSDTESVNGVGKADIETINGVGIPASGATLWVMGQEDRKVAYAANSDLTSWTSYDSFAGGSSPNPSSSKDYIAIAYGKDGSGDPMWVATHNTANCEIAYKGDPTTDDTWTGVSADAANANIINTAFFNVQWGGDFWIAVGKMAAGAALYRSPDGAAWTKIDLSQLTGIVTNVHVYGLASDGAGKWWFAQDDRIYQSTNHGAAWSLLHTLVKDDDSTTGKIRTLEYTNSTLVAITYLGASPPAAYSAASSDLTDWSTETILTDATNAGFDIRVASAAGRVVVAWGQLMWTMDVSGKSITMDSNDVDLTNDSHGNVFGLATDGTTYVAVCDTGDVLSSTDGGDSWSLRATNVGSEDGECIAANVYLPL